MYFKKKKKITKNKIIAAKFCRILQQNISFARQLEFLYIFAYINLISQQFDKTGKKRDKELITIIKLLYDI